MTDENDMTASAERLVGAELVRAAEALLVDLKPEVLDPALTARLATVRVLLDRYWELRHQRRAVPAVESAAGALAGEFGAGADAPAAVLLGVLSAGRPELADPPATTRSAPPADGS
jgi:hypothetical protein